MQKSVEFTGKNEEAAIATALEQLHLSREEVSVEVLQLARSGFLGIGSIPAKVKVTYEVPDEPAPSPKPVEKTPQAVAPPERIVYEIPKLPEVEKTPVAKTPVPEPDSAVEAVGDGTPEQEKSAAAEALSPAADELALKIDTFLTGLFEKMEVRAEPVISLDADGNYQVNLVGEGLGQIIGHRGETLDAIQQLTGYVVNRGRSQRVRIRVDAENYRAKREESLTRMAHRVADKAVRYRRNFTLDPMNAYERHVVHTALQNRPNVTTYSVGVEPNRRTVVAYAPGEPKK